MRELQSLGFEGCRLLKPEQGLCLSSCSGSCLCKGGGWSRYLVSATSPATLAEEVLKDPEDGTVGLVSYSVGYLQCAHSPPYSPCLGEAG